MEVDPAVAPSFEKDGFAFFRSVLSAVELAELDVETHRLMSDPFVLDRGKGGYALRHLLARSPTVLRFASSQRMIRLAESLLGKGAKPVKGILFDKGEAANWSVRWHQDATISVKQRRETPGFEGWSIKDGIPHVHPPLDILENIAALRVHLDDCGEDNGPLKVIPGSHRLGFAPREEVLRTVQENSAVVCIASRGDILAMKPLLVHSSGKSDSPRRRRVLHIEYACVDLPCGLGWFERED